MRIICAMKDKANGTKLYVTLFKAQKLAESNPLTITAKC